MWRALCVSDNMSTTPIMHISSVWIGDQTAQVFDNGRVAYVLNGEERRTHLGNWVAITIDWSEQAHHHWQYKSECGEEVPYSNEDLSTHKLLISLKGREAEYMGDGKIMEMGSTWDSVVLWAEDVLGKQFTFDTV